MRRHGLLEHETSVCGVTVLTFRETGVRCGLDVRLCEPTPKSILGTLAAKCVKLLFAFIWLLRYRLFKSLCNRPLDCQALYSGRHAFAEKDAASQRIQIR